MRIWAGNKVLGFSKSNNRKQQDECARRKSDTDSESVEAEVLKALSVMARRSSPHRATSRASMARAIGVIEGSMLGLRHIEELVEECFALCRSGLDEKKAENRSRLAERYAVIIDELDAIANGTGHGSVHLIGETSSILEVELGEPRSYKLKLPHINLTAGPSGLALPQPSQAFESTGSLKHFERHLKLVKDRLTRSAEIFQDHASDLAKRLALLLEGSFAESHELDKGRIEPARRPGLQDSRPQELDTSVSTLA